RSPGTDRRACPWRQLRYSCAWLLRVGLVLSLRAVPELPDITVRVGEGGAVPALLLFRRGLEDLCAGLLSLGNDSVDARLAAHDIVEDNAAEAAAVAVRAQANGFGEAVATVEADQGTAVRNEEDRNFEVLLDLPAEAIHVEALGSLHVLNAKHDRADVRVHSSLSLREI